MAINVNVNIWNLMYSMRSVSKWQESIQSNLNGALRNGYKEHEVVFGGNTIYDLRSPTLTSAGIQVAEQSISTGFTRNIWKPGDLVSTESLTDYAINGDGLFMAYDPKDSKIYYTRDGSFRANHTGQLTNAQGLILVDSALAINLGTGIVPYTPVAPTNAQVIAHDTNWQPLANVGANGAAPWWLNNSNAYLGQDYTVQIKKTFTVNGASLTGAETLNVGVDNVAHVFVNGVLVSPPAGIQNNWGAPTTLNIGPYLKDGANTIFIQAANVGAGLPSGPATNPAGISIAGTAGGVNLNADPTWAIKAAPKQNPFAIPEPEDTYALPKEILLLDYVKRDQLKYSKYGSTFFQLDSALTALDIALAETGNNGYVVQKALESSNVNINKQIAALSSSKQLQEALTKQFLVYYSNIDIGIELIK